MYEKEKESKIEFKTINPLFFLKRPKFMRFKSIEFHGLESSGKLESIIDLRKFGGGWAERGFNLKEVSWYWDSERFYVDFHIATPNQFTIFTYSVGTDQNGVVEVTAKENIVEIFFGKSILRAKLGVTITYNIFDLDDDYKRLLDVLTIPVGVYMTAKVYVKDFVALEKYFGG